MNNGQLTECDLNNMIKKLEDLPKEKRKQATMIEVQKIFGDSLPESLIELSNGFFVDGDSGENIDEKPSWLDLEKFRRGQKFCEDHSFAISFNELLAVFFLLSFDTGLNALIFTGASSTPYKAFKRYLSTHFRFVNWFTSDPWTRGTPAYNDIKYTRQIHNMSRKNLLSTSEEMYKEKVTLNPVWSVSAKDIREDFKSTFPAINPGQCVNEIFKNASNQTFQYGNQTSMSITQFGFCGLIVYKPHLFGIHDASDEDLEAFCHLWRGIGYLLGIDDNYNFCRGTLEDVRTRSKVVLDYWIKPNFCEISPEYEHMIRCMSESMHYIFPIVNFECLMLHLAEIIDVAMPRFFASLPYHIKCLHYIQRFYFHYGSKISALRRVMTYSLNQALLKAKNFDNEKHEQLKIKSEKTLASFS